MADLPMADVPAAPRRRRGSGMSRYARQKARDPNLPKRPVSSYFAWYGKNRAKFVEALGTSNRAAVAAYGKEQWEQVSESKKAKLTARYMEELGEWKAKMAEYKQTSEYADFKAAQQAAKEAIPQQTGAYHAAARGNGAKRGFLESCTDEELIGELNRRLRMKRIVAGEGALEAEGSTTSTSAGSSGSTANTTSTSGSGPNDEEDSEETEGFLAYMEARRPKWEKAGGGPEKAFKLDTWKRWNNLPEETKQQWEDSVEE